MQTLPAMLLEIPSKKWCNKIDSSKSMAYSGLDFFTFDKQFDWTENLPQDIAMVEDITWLAL